MWWWSTVISIASQNTVLSWKKINVKKGKATCLLGSQTDKRPPIFFTYFFRPEEVVWQAIIISCKYQNRLPIGKTKYQDLLKLFEKKIILPGYKNLPHGTGEPKIDCRGESDDEIYKLDII